MSASVAVERKPHKLFAERRSGVLLHLSSLPDGHGCGDLGPGAFAFADWLRDAGQGWWQMLPTVPLGHGDSPYSSTSAFAGSMHFLSLHGLVEDGLLGEADLCAPESLESGRADFSGAWEFKQPRLRTACARFLREGGKRKLAAFRRRHEDWLPDFALFQALKRRYEGAAWTEWPAALRDREAEALEAAREELRDEVRFEEFLQFQFMRQWKRLRRHCKDRGVHLLGDLPIFVVHDSADVWARPELFQLDDRGRPKVVTGVPPDSFSDDGQLWGHPHYRWRAHREEGFDWWLRRFERLLEQFDAVRVDHFIGFVRAWQVRAGARTARKGRWASSPGGELLDALENELGSVPVVAEDLGAVTPAVHKLRDRFALPGMRILQWAFGGNGRYDQPHNHPELAVVYPGTHDNDTIRGWFAGLPDDERRRVVSYSGGRPDTISWDLVRLAWSSPACTSIASMQDLLGLDGSARMNFPGTTEENWLWRMVPGAASPTLARSLRELTEAFERLP